MKDETKKAIEGLIIILALGFGIFGYKTTSIVLMLLAIYERLYNIN